MTKEQIETRLKEKETELENLKTAHQKFIEQFNLQLTSNRDEYNKLVGAIAELQMISKDETPPQ